MNRNSNIRCNKNYEIQIPNHYTLNDNIISLNVYRLNRIVNIIDKYIDKLKQK